MCRFMTRKYKDAIDDIILENTIIAEAHKKYEFWKHTIYTHSTDIIFSENSYYFYSMEILSLSQCPTVIMWPVFVSLR